MGWDGTVRCRERRKRRVEGGRGQVQGGAVCTVGRRQAVYELTWKKLKTGIS